jgi:energy-coupling factor transporter ATP-binding protein EcfA2
LPAGFGWPDLNVAMGELVVLTGPPGAGKSSVSEHLANGFTPSALVVGDAFFAMMKQGYILPWLPAARHQNSVIIEAAAAAAGRLTDLCFVVYDGVLGPWFLPTFGRATGLSRVHYSSCCPILRPAWTVSGVELVTDSLICRSRVTCISNFTMPS